MSLRKERFCRLVKGLALTVSDATPVPTSSSAQGDPETQHLVIENDYGRFAQIPRPVLLSSVSIGAKVAYANLWDFSQGGEGDIHPSYRLLAERMRASESSVKRWLNELARAGFISKSRRHRQDGGYTSNAYRILVLTHTPPVNTPQVMGDPYPQVMGDLTKKETQVEGGSKREIEIPDSWVPTGEHRERAANTGLDLDREVEKFRAHAEEHGRKAKSWNAAFTRWLITAVELQGRRWPSQSARGKTDMDRMAEIMSLETSPEAIRKELERRMNGQTA